VRVATGLVIAKIRQRKTVKVKVKYGRKEKNVGLGTVIVVALGPHTNQIVVHVVYTRKGFQIVAGKVMS